MLYSIEEVVPQVTELICQLPGKEACTAVCIVLDVYTGTKKFLDEQGEGAWHGIE